MLSQLHRQGATVGMKTPPWNQQQKQDALQQGSHQFAEQHNGFLCEEFVDLIQKRQWVLLTADLVLHEPNLRLSTLGVVTQHDRRPRTICDNSFFLVNLDTTPLAPVESMQFGRYLWRILTNIHKADHQLGPVFLSKVDIADGFYRIQVNANDVQKLGVVVPTEPGQPQLIGSPLFLPMVWMQSPPLFTDDTETVADLTNQALLDSAPAGPHRLDVVSESEGPVPGLAPSSLSMLTTVHLPTKPMPRGRPRPPVKSWDVYVDDFIGMVQ
jgi:hypothetical protein